MPALLGFEPRIAESEVVTLPLNNVINYFIDELQPYNEVYQN